MADTAARLADRVFPIVPVRQWVLSLPFGLRYRMTYDARLTSDVLNVFIRVVFEELRRRASELLDVRSSQCGAVTFVPRCCGASRHPYFDRFESDSMSSPLDNLDIACILYLDHLEEHSDYEFSR